MIVENNLDQFMDICALHACKNTTNGLRTHMSIHTTNNHLS